MTTLQWMVKTQEKAAESGCLCYLYTNGDEYYISQLYAREWIFRAYPGGRRELSTIGAKLVEEQTGEVL